MLHLICKRTRLGLTRGSVPVGTDTRGPPHAVSHWWGSYPVSPDNGIRQGAPSPVIVSSGPDRAGSILVECRRSGNCLLLLNFRCEGTAGHHHWRSPGLAIRVLGGGMYLRQSPGPFCPGPSFHMYKKQDHTGIGLVGIGRMGVLTNHLGSSITTSYLVHGFLGNL
jgi:hypothetical protein